MNAVEFKLATGREPFRDDLERANCPHGGKLGKEGSHLSCGVCIAHGKPVFECGPCFQLAGSMGTQLARRNTPIICGCTEPDCDREMIVENWVKPARLVVRGHGSEVAITLADEQAVLLLVKQLLTSPGR